MKDQLIRWGYRTFYKKQSILVIATVRSGGTSMLNAIGDAYKQDVVFEPHTPDYAAEYNPFNSTEVKLVGSGTTVLSPNTDYYVSESDGLTKFKLSS